MNRNAAAAKPTNLELRDAFDGIAHRYDQMSNSYAQTRRCEILCAWAAGRCLEVGAGSGNLAVRLKSQCEVVATDISPKMAAEIQKKQIEAHVADAEHLPFPNASFDTLVATELIYLLDRPERFLAEAKRVLKPGGVLLLSSANNNIKFFDRVRALLRDFGFKGMYFDDQIREFMSPWRLNKLLEAAGFAVIVQRSIILFPLGALDRLNRMIEKTRLSRLGVFTLTKAIG